MYKRKTRDAFEIWWDGGYGKECIDTADTRADARYLRNEYQIAYQGSVWIKRVRVKI